MCPSFTDFSLTTLTVVIATNTMLCISTDSLFPSLNYQLLHRILAYFEVCINTIATSCVVIYVSVAMEKLNRAKNKLVVHPSFQHCFFNTVSRSLAGDGVQTPKYRKLRNAVTKALNLFKMQEQIFKTFLNF